MITFVLNLNPNGLTKNINNCYEQESKNIQVGIRYFYSRNDSHCHKHGHEHHCPLEQEKISTKSILADPNIEQQIASIDNLLIQNPFNIIRLHQTFLQFTITIRNHQTFEFQKCGDIFI